MSQTTPQVADEREGLPSASSFEREVNCPAWRPLVREILASGQKLPTESELAAQGTRIHAAFELDDPAELELEEKAIYDGIQRAADVALLQWKEQVLRVPAETVVRELREVRLWVRDLGTLSKLASAKCDRLYIHGEHALDIDAKTGYKDQTPSERNWQIRLQCLAVKHEFPEVKYIRGGIGSSRLKTSLDLADYTDVELDQVYNELLRARWRSAQPNPRANPGPWCDYCPAKTWCRPAIVNAALTSWEMKGLKKKEVSERVAMMRPEGLAFIWARHTEVNNVMEAVKDRLKCLPLPELNALGFTLAPGRKLRSIKDPTVAAARIPNQLTLTDFISICKPSVAQLEKLAALKGVSYEELKKALGDQLVETTSSQSLTEL